MTEKTDGIPLNQVKFLEVEFYDDDDPLSEDEIEIPFFDSLEEFQKWQNDIKDKGGL